MIHRTCLEASGAPKLFYPSENSPNLVGIAFEFMKRIPARFCIERALNPIGRMVLNDSGVFEKLSTANNSEEVASIIGTDREGEKRLFIETSSGNMATGLAEVCQHQGIPLSLVLPETVDEGTRRSLTEFGAKIDISPTTDQEKRIERLFEMKKEYEALGWEVSWVEQYTNPNNRISYWRLAEFLAAEFDRIDKFVAPVGTGGSSCGTAAYLRRAGFPNLKLIGVDACGSVNFDHRPSDFLMGGIGSTRSMPLVDPKAYDVVHWIDDNTAFAASIELFDSGVPVGGSSGAAFVAARYEAQKAPEDIVLVMFPDHARRYADTIRSEEWRRENNIVLEQAHTVPKHVQTAQESDPSMGAALGWYRIDWRTYWARKTQNLAS